MDRVLRFLLLLYALHCSAAQRRPSESDVGVSDLTYESKFRSVKLTWRYPPPVHLGFVVTMCAPPSGDCFERHLLMGKNRVGNPLHSDTLTEDAKGRYSATLWGLRMRTNYTVAVEPMEEQNGVHQMRKWLHLQTKGFSAHATNCLSNSSDIVVHSGPYFGGKIMVEGSTDDRCALYGDRASSRDTYTLKIDHALCGSKTVNESRVETVVVVHESPSVVTHNSRRFLVQCNFLPDTFTIKAAFNIPRDSGINQKNLNYRQMEEALKNEDNNVYTYSEYKQNHVKDSRMSSEQAHWVQGSPPEYETQMLSLLVVIIVLVIVIVVVIGFSLWCYIHTSRRRSDDIETLSTSGSSFLAYDGEMRPWGHAACYPPAPTPSPFMGHQVALVSLKPVKELY